LCNNDTSRQAKAAEKLDIWTEELGEMCTMIAYQLDRANSVEQAATSGEPVVEPLPPANSQSPSSSTTGGPSGGKMLSNSPPTGDSSSGGSSGGGGGASNGGSTKRPLPPASCRAMASAAGDGIRIGDAGAKGLGAFADRDFDADVTVGDYQGEWMSVRYVFTKLDLIECVLVSMHLMANSTFFIGLLANAILSTIMLCFVVNRDLDARYPHTCAPLPPGAPPRPPPTMVRK